jgi:hypothetical protein
MTKTHSNKDFDAIAMKRRAARKIHERLSEKEKADRLAYWQERTEALRQRQADHQASRSSSS